MNIISTIKQIALVCRLYNFLVESGRF